jgi:SAM-dependent methyltransferase
VLSLGDMPLANALLAEEDLQAPEPRYPLDLVYCHGCKLVQITETVPPELLFRHYLYFSSFSDTFLTHAKMLADRVIAERGLGRESRVIEVASNDGYLLQYYRERGISVLGIEPAANVARVAEEQRGIPTLCAFFGRDLAQELRGRGERADVLHAHNVLAHVVELNGFVAGLRDLIKDDGVVVVEVPYVKEMVERCEFDTIYHEHLCYFSLTALETLFGRQDLEITHVERLGIHGGSLRLFAEPMAARGQRGAAVTQVLAQEHAAGIASADYYAGFATRAAALMEELRACLDRLTHEGQRLAAYGAAAKGTVLLNALGAGRETIAFAVDRSPHKQGHYIPGVRVPIRPVEALLDEQPDYVLLLVWNLMDEVLAQQSEYRERGGRFIVPLPEVKIL